MGIPVTHTLAQNQKRAMDQARATQESENHGSTTLSVQDMGEQANYVIYIYNIIDWEWILNQPPQFATYRIPACKPGEKFAYNIMPAFVNEVYNRTGTTELYYKRVDGRKYATSMLNPSAFPGIQWEGQLNDWKTEDQFGNNLNAFGCFWSLTRPDETAKLDVEIKFFKERVRKTMQALVKTAEQLATSGRSADVSPLMHFAMDYLGISAGWHTSLKHMVSCPNCGEPVQEGIAYHKNAFGEKCIIDEERYMRSVAVPRKQVHLAEEEDEEEQAVVPEAPKPKRRKV
jgi:hypothetical protein